MNLIGRTAVAACAAQLSVRALSHHHSFIRNCRISHRCFAKQLRVLERHFEDACTVDAELDILENGLPPFQATLQFAAALLAAICLHLGSAQAADALDLASASEDKLLGVVRVLETQTDSAFTALRSAVSGLRPFSQDPQAAAANRAAAVSLINEVFEVVDRNFEDARKSGYDPVTWRRARDRVLSRPLPDTAAAHSAVREMLSLLKDPYSRFLTPEEFGAMVKYDVSGVGLNLGTLEDLRAKTDLVPDLTQRQDSSGGGDGGVWVVGLIRNSLAAAAGVQQGDEILSLDGAPMTQQSPFQVASLLQGKEEQEEEETSDKISEDIGSGSGSSAAQQQQPPVSMTLPYPSSSPSSVKITVRHLGGSEEEIFLSRPSQKSSPPTPVVSRLEGNVGYVKLSSFTAKAQRDVATAVRRLQDSGAQKLVLDLRGNRGGLVSEGIEVAKLFLDSDAVVVRTQGKARSSSTPPTAPGPPLTTAPLAVLVDNHTASASEIFAGAIQDNCRGVLVGKQTYGKGLIQSVYELGDGSGMVLTVGKYLTPGGTDIDWQGLKPDFKGMPSPKEAEDAVQACRIRHE